MQPRDLHGARLIAVTQPRIKGDNGDVLTAEELIVYCARVSNPSNQGNTETAPKLLASCIRRSEWSILEMANLTVEIKTTRAISPQIIRHWSLHFQEFSQRYSNVPTDQLGNFELRMQGESRQGGDNPLPTELESQLRGKLAFAADFLGDLYEQMIESGVARECARNILPLNSPTCLYANGTVRDLLFYAHLRRQSATQKEHRWIADDVWEILRQEFPNVVKAFESLKKKEKEAVMWQELMGQVQKRYKITTENLVESLKNHFLSQVS